MSINNNAIMLILSICVFLNTFFLIVVWQRTNDHGKKISLVLYLVVVLCLLGVLCGENISLSNSHEYYK